MNKQNFPYWGVNNPNELVNEILRLVLKLTVVAGNWLDFTFLKMIMAEHLQLAKSTIVEYLQSSISQNYVKKLEDEMIGCK